MYRLCLYPAAPKCCFCGVEYHFTPPDKHEMNNEDMILTLAGQLILSNCLMNLKNSGDSTGFKPNFSGS